MFAVDTSAILAATAAAAGTAGARTGLLELSGRCTRWQYFRKRLFDIVVASGLLLLLAPVMAAVAIVIVSDSRGPVLFVQERVGSRPRFGRTRCVWETRCFRFYKFRSMFADVDQTAHANHIRAFVHGTLPGAAGSGSRFKLGRDPRITRVGRFLRRSSLDELPQLVNVLKGDMSLVGPRPVPLYEVAEYQPGDLERLAALPGLTGLWQVRGRADLSFDDMMRLDREYVRRRSLWLDARLLLETIPAVLSGRGAG